MLTVHPIRAFSDNYIWCLSDTETGRALVVDPGQARPVLEHLNEHHLRLDTILVTHHHPDHVGGVPELHTHAPDCRIIGPANSPFKGISEPVQPGAKATWYELAFSVLGVPGHTLDHIAYFCETAVNGRPILFCGDTLFVCGCGRLFEGSPGQMRHSLEAIRSLPESTAVYCAHEYTLANLRFARSWLPEDANLKAFEDHCKKLREKDEPTVPSNLAQERQLNPFLRWDDPSVERAALAYCEQHNLPSDSADAIFAAIRHGKDNF
ncbi:hydroxyacylglutathione hydrolase [Marinobacter salinisoli]|uniref:Hydroxyacylglutathione hydrolase n=1 Tax=Marinobacter salinisoli TaxID=2769486 RepID=A0ABX7MND6_9GAMM|nr:hydroxyacylglutathione hydrolase [Marinobacter salinisoli]QSP93771.1 hydroxyacylglutathione hydrolase [Marinobacter salinisoli]